MKYKLKRAVWEITLACCFSCKYCGSSGGKARNNELTTVECLDLVDQLAELGCQRVSMIGGEVFMRKDWEEIVRALTDKGIKCNIITNGFLFRDDLIKRLKSCRVESVSVSLDGPKTVHDKYRQEGSYDRALSAIECLSGAGIPVSVISTLNAENVNYLEEFGNILKKMDIFAWQLQACSPMGNAAKAGLAYAFDFGRVIKFVEDNLNSFPFIVGIADNIGYYSPSDGYLRGSKTMARPFSGCSAGLESIGIDSVGNIRGCESMYDEAFTEGNIREKSLREIWENPESFSYNRKFTPDKLTGSCAKCEKAGKCAGGCRSYNFFVHRKLYESPTCINRKK